MSLDADPYVGLESYDDFGLDLIWEPGEEGVNSDAMQPDLVATGDFTDDLPAGISYPVEITKRKACGDDKYSQSTMFLTARRGSVEYEQQRQAAKDICGSCAALDQCRELARALPVDTGFYNAMVIAGMDTTERARFVLAPTEIFPWRDFPKVERNASFEERRHARAIQREAIAEACANLLISGGTSNVTFDNVANVTGCSPSNLSDIMSLLEVSRSELLELAESKINQGS